MPGEVLVREWEPHPKQAKILADDTRHRVVPAGRRFGKTRMGRAAGLEYAFENPGSLVWFVAPTDADAAELGFEPMLAELPRDLLDREPKRSPPREIYVNGSTIQFRSAESQGRGRGIDLVVGDESGDWPSHTWQEVIRPSLLDTGGRALLLGTPRGRNWFYEVFLRGEDPDDADFNSWQATTYDNPHILDAEIDAERETMPDRVFRQEYLAEFVADEGDVFGPVRERNARPYAVDDVTGVGPYTTGVDIARQSDYLVACTLDADGMLVGFHRDRGFSWSKGRRVLTDYLSGFPGACYMDAQRDNSVVEDIIRAAAPEVRVEPVKFTPQAKADLVENLAARLETQGVIIPEKQDASTDTLINELEAFTYESKPSGRVSYHAPEGYHDDCVDALALAAKHATAETSTW